MCVAMCSYMRKRDVQLPAARCVGKRGRCVRRKTEGRNPTQTCIREMGNPTQKKKIIKKNKQLARAGIESPSKQPHLSAVLCFKKFLFVHVQRPDPNLP